MQYLSFISTRLYQKNKYISYNYAVFFSSMKIYSGFHSGKPKALSSFPFFFFLHSLFGYISPVQKVKSTPGTMGQKKENRNFLYSKSSSIVTPSLMRRLDVDTGSSCAPVSSSVNRHERCVRVGWSS